MGTLHAQGQVGCRFRLKKTNVRRKKMSDSLAKQVQAAGTKISKEKLIEALRKSSHKDFPYYQSSGSKTVVVVLAL
jgi:hypothetical protein